MTDCGGQRPYLLPFSLISSLFSINPFSPFSRAGPPRRVAWHRRRARAARPSLGGGRERERRGEARRRLASASASGPAPAEARGRRSQAAAAEARRRALPGSQQRSHAPGLGDGRPAPPMIFFSFSDVYFFEFRVV